MCDELARGLQRSEVCGRLVEDVRGLVSSHLEETFCCFMEGEGPKVPSQLEAKDAAAQVGGSSPGARWARYAGCGPTRYQVFTRGVLGALLRV